MLGKLFAIIMVVGFIFGAYLGGVFCIKKAAEVDPALAQFILILAVVFLFGMVMNLKI